MTERSLLNTLTVAVGSRHEPAVRHDGVVGGAGRWAVAAHVRNFDDLQHIESTTHISAVCVPATLACGGGPREFLASAGVMARLGCGARLAALHRRLARHVSGRSAGTGRRCGPQPGIGQRAHRHRHGPRRAVRPEGSSAPSAPTPRRSMWVKPWTPADVWVTPYNDVERDCSPSETRNPCPA